MDPVAHLDAALGILGISLGVGAFACLVSSVPLGTYRNPTWFERHMGFFAAGLGTLAALSFAAAALAYTPWNYVSH